MGQNRILVTGGAGFIGSNLIEALNDQGHEDILVVDYLGEGDKFKNLVPLRLRDYCEADEFLNKINASSQFFGHFNTVYHLGACSSTTESNNRYLIQNNFSYTKSLALWSLAQASKFVYASSAATYGDGSAGMSDDASSLDQLRPLNMYAYSKHLFDQYAFKEGFLHRIRGIKYFNIFGSNETHKGNMRSMVHKAFEQISSRGRIQLFKSYSTAYKDGEQMRDFLYVKDAVKATLFLGQEKPSSDQKRQCHEGIEGGLFNLGMGQAHTWIELITPIFHALNRPVEIEYIEMPEVLRAKYQYFTQANIQKLKRQKDFNLAFTPLKEAVSDYVLNYLKPAEGQFKG